MPLSGRGYAAITCGAYVPLIGILCSFSPQDFYAAMTALNVLNPAPLRGSDGGGIG